MGIESRCPSVSYVGSKVIDMEIKRIVSVLFVLMMVATTVGVLAQEDTTPDQTVIPTYLVEGTVTDEAGEPLTSAVVALLGKEVAERGIVDENGSYSFEVPRDRYVLVVVAKEYVPFREAVPLNESMTIDVTLKAKADVVLGNLSGTITDGEGAPLAGVDVYIEGQGRHRATRTDENGEYTFEGLGEGPHGLAAIKRGYTVFKARINVTGGADLDQDISLGQKEVLVTATLTGTVTNATDVPVENATVGLRGLGLGERTSTDDTGAYSLADVPAGKYVLSAGADGLARQDIDVVIGRDRDNETALFLFRDIVPTLDVEEKEFRYTAPAFRVDLFVDPSEYEIVTRTEGELNGTLLVHINGTLVITGGVTATVEGEGYLRLSGMVGNRTYGRLDVMMNGTLIVETRNGLVTAEGALMIGGKGVIIDDDDGYHVRGDGHAGFKVPDLSLTFALNEAVEPPTHHHEGRITDEQGRPLENATVIIRSGENVYRVRTNETGDYSVDGLREGGAQVIVLHEDRVPVKRTVQIREEQPPREGEQPQDKDRHQFQVRSQENTTRAPVEGRMRDENGMSLHGAEIELRGITGSYDMTTDSNGRFRTEEVIPGRYVATIRKDGYDDVTVPIEVTEDGIRGLGFEMRPEPQKLKSHVVGSVVTGFPDATQGIPGAEITIRGKEFTARPVMTDANGRFTFANVPEGNYHLSVGKPGFAPMEFDVGVHNDSGEMRFVIHKQEFDQDRVVRARFLNETRLGRPDPVNIIEAITGDNGSFIVDVDPGLTALDLGFKVGLHGKPPALGVEPVPPMFRFMVNGTVTEVDGGFNATGALYIRGGPEVVVMTETGGFWVPGTAHFRGEGTILVDENGTVKILALGGVAIDVGGRADVTQLAFNLKPQEELRFGSVNGNITFSDGSSASEGIPVRIRTQDGKEIFTRTGAEGSFELPRVFAGQHRVMVDYRDPETGMLYYGMADITVDEDGNVDVTVKLMERGGTIDADSEESPPEGGVTTTRPTM